MIPILPLHNVLVFPKTMIPLEVAGSDSALLVDEAMTEGQAGWFDYGQKRAG